MCSLCVCYYYPIIVVIISCKTTEEGTVTGPIPKGTARARALKRAGVWRKGGQEQGGG